MNMMRAAALAFALGLVAANADATAPPATVHAARKTEAIRSSPVINAFTLRHS